MEELAVIDCTVLLNCPAGQYLLFVDSVTEGATCFEL